MVDSERKLGYWKGLLAISSSTEKKNEKVRGHKLLMRTNKAFNKESFIANT